ncbi:uncharacterized protein LOC134236538 [Saccostrea cucullata]|uniref:uncharacterized protein LOC134236538 n=1 Tax=Saccostrea cuccullata TaxID=36930 RepID=UPI002ED34E71
MYVKKGKEYNLFLPTCSSFSKTFSSPIYLEQASSDLLVPLQNCNNCSCVCREPVISGRLPVYQEMIEDFVMKRLALEPCCPVGRHGTHKHFSTIKDSQIVPNDQISSYQSPLDRHVEKVIEVLDTQGRKLDQINGGKGSLEQCLSREIFGDENKISFLKSRFCLGEAMTPEEILAVIANSTEKPVFVFKYYPENYSWILTVPDSTTSGDGCCRYYITIFYNGLTKYFDRIVAKNGCNCKLPSPAVDIRTKIDLKRDEKKILVSNRHRPLLTFLSDDVIISEALFIDEVRRVPKVFSRYSEIPIIMSRNDMQDKEIDFMSDYSYSLCRCVSKEIFGTENEFQLIMKELVNEICENPHLYGKFMRLDKDETEDNELHKNFTSRRRTKWDFVMGQAEKKQAVYYANRIRDGMEMEDLELLAIATRFQVPVFVICVEEEKGQISTSWKEFTQLKRKHRPKHIREIAREHCCNMGSDGSSNFFVMVYRTFSGQFHRIVSKDMICNCLIDHPNVPKIEYHKPARADKNIFAKMRSIENRLTVTRLALDNWIRCNMALELLCTEIIDGLECRRKNVNIASIVGSSVGLVGAALAVGGLIAAPFTAGVSLGLTIAGGVVGGVGGFTSAGSKISEFILNKETVSQMERYQMNLRERSRNLEKSIKAVEKEFKELLTAKDYVECMDNNSLELATSALRSLTVVPVVLLRIIARAITLGDMIIVPLSALLDAGILVFSIHNLVKGCRTRETERLRTIRTILKVTRVQMQIWGYGNQKKWEKNTNEIPKISES